MANNYISITLPGYSPGVVFTETGGGGNTATISAPGSITSDYTLRLPPNDGNTSDVLTTDGAGILTWSSVASASILPRSIISTPLTINNIANATVGYLPWDNSAYSSISSITCVFWHANMATSGRDLIVSTFDGTNTSSTTVSAPTADGITSFSITVPSSDSTIEIRARRTIGSAPSPQILGLSIYFS